VRYAVPKGLGYPPTPPQMPGLRMGTKAEARTEVEEVGLVFPRNDCGPASQAFPQSFNTHVFTLLCLRQDEPSVDLTPSP
jgi:hypothetical protein